MFPVHYFIVITSLNCESLLFTTTKTKENIDIFF